MAGKTRRILRRPCADCGRMLPKREFRGVCAGCVKGGQGKPLMSEWDMARAALKRRLRERP